MKGMLRIKHSKSKLEELEKAKLIAEELYHSAKLKKYFEIQVKRLHRRLQRIFSKEELEPFDLLYHSPQGQHIPLVVFDDIEDCNQSIDFKKLKENVDNETYFEILTEVKKLIKDKSPKGTLRKVVTNSMKKRNIVVKTIR